MPLNPYNPESYEEQRRIANQRAELLTASLFIMLYGLAGFILVVCGWIFAE